MPKTADIACQQFMIEGAGETIQAVPELDEVFSPPHHGPRNVPITVKLLKASKHKYSYTHFPIVRTGRYAIYLDTAGAFDGMVYSGTNQNTGTGTPIPTRRTNTGGCKCFEDAAISKDKIIFTQNDPQPVALRFSNKKHGGKKIRYIVSLVDED
ncbi:MAG: hypothetical protein AAGN66_14325 [Acidobacteriota bacterium]